MTETLVSAEIAQVLKDKGFDWKCNSYAIHPNIPTNDSDLGYSAPTLSHAAMWLREVKNVHVFVSPMKYWSGWSFCIAIKEEETTSGDWMYDTHDTALSAGILSALKMI